MSRIHLAAATAFVALALPAAAQAHVEADPSQAPAGASATLALHVGHGCKESPTTRLTLRLPAGSRAVRPLRTPGWGVSVRALGGGAAEITWTGGSLPSAETGEFRFRAALPGEAGDTVYLKTVQRCASGSQTNWVELPGDDGLEPEVPAPSVKLTDGAVRAPASHEAAGHADDGAGDAAPAAATATGGGSDDGGPSGALIAALVGGTTLLAGAGAVAVRRGPRRAIR
jgi:uncharacterized protein YcnI